MVNLPHLKSVILFDGICNLCDASVRFVIKRDPSHRFVFCPFQTNTGKELTVQMGLTPASLDTLVLIESGRAYVKSTAWLRILKSLGTLWPVFYVFMILPEGFRDWIYDCISRNRYRWFGKQDQCMIPEPKIKQRFLTD